MLRSGKEAAWKPGSPAWAAAAQTLFGEACHPWVMDLRLVSAVL